MIVPSKESKQHMQIDEILKLFPLTSETRQILPVSIYIIVTIIKHCFGSSIHWNKTKIVGIYIRKEQIISAFKLYNAEKTWDFSRKQQVELIIHFEMVIHNKYAKTNSFLFISSH